MSKFKIGDKVKWIRNGQRGVIIGSCKSYPNCWNIGVDGYNSCHEDYLELIHDTKNGYIILIKNNWNRYEIIKNHFNGIKIFKSREQAILYCKELDISEYQILPIEL